MSRKDLSPDQHTELIHLERWWCEFVEKNENDSGLGFTLAGENKKRYDKLRQLTEFAGEPWTQQEADGLLKQSEIDAEDF